MRSHYIILFLTFISSCVIRTNSSQSVYSELYSLDLQSPKLADDCYYLEVFDEICFGENESQLDFRLLLIERNMGTKIISIFDIKNRFLIVMKSIEPGYDNLFTIITEDLPLQYSVKKMFISKEKYNKWKSNFLEQINSEDSIISPHDRKILKVEYKKDESVERIEVRGDLNEVLESLLRSI